MKKIEETLFTEMCSVSDFMKDIPKEYVEGNTKAIGGVCHTLVTFLGDSIFPKKVRGEERDKKLVDRAKSLGELFMLKTITGIKSECCFDGFLQLLEDPITEYEPTMGNIQDLVHSVPNCSFLMANKQTAEMINSLSLELPVKLYVNEFMGDSYVFAGRFASWMEDVGRYTDGFIMLLHKGSENTLILDGLSGNIESDYHYRVKFYNRLVLIQSHKQIKSINAIKIKLDR